MRSAVSARPLRAPWVEMKYSSTERPSMKLALIGRSMISPFGLTMSPRIPASWRIWLNDPRAPESAIMNTVLVRWRLACIASPTLLVASVQTSTTRSLRSSSVIIPRRYSRSISATVTSYPARISSLFGWHDDVVLRDGDPGPRGVLERERLDRVEHGGDRVGAVVADELVDRRVELTLGERLVDDERLLHLAAHCVAKRAGDLLLEDDATRGGQPASPRRGGTRSAAGA